MKKSTQYHLTLLFFIFSVSAKAQQKPNIVLIFPDNLGIGEVSAYGGVRGVPTPNIDRIGTEGIRLTNFNVEYSCVPSRAAIMTGRYATRTGENYFSGLTLWEVTLAEALRSAGYATGLFGKWDMGGPNWEGRREPMQQGFDEWYGIPGTSHVSQFTSFEGFDSTRQPVPYIWEGATGVPARKVKPFDLATRRTLDREAAEHAVAFMEKQAGKKQPFFVFYPMTQLHFPALAHPDKAGTTGAGDMGDAMADVDYNTGLILDALKRLKIDNNTLVIWCTDNGAEMRRPWRGSPGPWRGYYNTAMEGGIRTPCLVRWPGRIPAGQVSNEMVHEVDLFATIAAAAGVPGIVPADRATDGVNQLPFLEGRQNRSDRESAIYMNWTGQVMAVKWRDWKLWYRFQTELPDPDPDNLVRLFDLRADPQEETDVKDYYPWVIGIMDGIVREYEASLAVYPRVPANAPDPYAPPAKGSGSPFAVYSRTDRQPLGSRSDALPNPDFSGSWSTAVLETRSPLGRVDQAAVPTLGSGWGDKISIKHSADRLEVERVVFVPRELQPPIRYRYALDGSQTENPVNMGRTGAPPVSTTTWDGNRLVITTLYPFQDPETGERREQKVMQTLWLAPPAGTPWEPTLVVETSRA
ncbi:MAG: sulfatase-like hydrolase/transferase, partial [Candidatus Omnitrophica bacterium]|nr:sulfatase-like hydrolase/transferase [Candidatus Omnitrophota bacterium]